MTPCAQHWDGSINACNDLCMRRWLVSGPAQHQRAENGLQADQWSYNVPVPAGAIYQARVSLLQARAPCGGLHLFWPSVMGLCQWL